MNIGELGHRSLSAANNWQTELEAYVSPNTNSAMVKPNSKHKHWKINAPLFYSIGSFFGLTFLKIHVHTCQIPFYQSKPPVKIIQRGTSPMF